MKHAFCFFFVQTDENRNKITDVQVRAQIFTFTEKADQLFPPR